jgi:hypothetical protein
VGGLDSQSTFCAFSSAAADSRCAGNRGYREERDIFTMAGKVETRNECDDRGYRQQGFVLVSVHLVNRIER